MKAKVIKQGTVEIEKESRYLNYKTDEIYPTLQEAKIAWAAGAIIKEECRFRRVRDGIAETWSNWEIKSLWRL